jgi:hypothetical protein
MGIDKKAVAVSMLKSILTAKLLRAVHDLLYPEPPGTQLNWNTVLDETFGHGFNAPTEKTWYDLTYEAALLPISKLGKEHLPGDMLQFLPPPSDDDFPILCIGLVHLFDQGSAILFSKGTDARYVNAYFRPLSLRVIHQCFADVPPHLQPWNASRWAVHGYTWEQVVQRLTLFFAPLTHSEALADQALQQGLFEQMRSETETRTGVTDVYAPGHREDAHDTSLFRKVIRAGPPNDESLGRKLRIDDYVWFTTRVHDAHAPIIRKFGRYPYRNGQEGRETREEEREWLKENDGFGTPSLTEEDLETLKEDVKQGKWTPLKGPDNPRDH